MLLVLVGSLLLAQALGFWIVSQAGSSARVVATMQPLAIGELFQAPGTERDRDADARAAANEAQSPEVVDTVEAMLGRPVTISAEVADVDAGTIEIVAETGDVGASQQAAELAAQALLQRRAAAGIDRADGGALAVEQTLATLEEQRADMSDAEQIAAQEQRLFDQQASLDQLRQSRDQLVASLPGTYTPAVPRAGMDAFLPVFLLLFALFVSTGLLLRWAVRRWRGPVTWRRGVLGVSATVLEVRSGEDVVAFARGVVLEAGRDHGDVVQVAAAAPTAEGAAGAFARAVAEQIAHAHAAAFVDGVGSLGAEADRALVTDEVHEPGDLGRPLLVDAAPSGVDLAGAVATAGTRRAVAELAGRHDVVVVHSPPATTLAAVAWSAHAGEVVLVVEVRATTQREARDAVAALRRARPDEDLRVVLLPEGGPPRAPAAASPRPVAGAATR